MGLGAGGMRVVVGGGRGCGCGCGRAGGGGGAGGVVVGGRGDAGAGGVGLGTALRSAFLPGGGLCTVGTDNVSTVPTAGRAGTGSEGVVRALSDDTPRFAAGDVGEALGDGVAAVTVTGAGGSDPPAPRTGCDVHALTTASTTTATPPMRRPDMLTPPWRGWHPADLLKATIRRDGTWRPTDEVTT